jgi:hypothetical protein
MSVDEHKALYPRATELHTNGRVDVDQELRVQGNGTREIPEIIDNVHDAERYRRKYDGVHRLSQSL